MTPLKLAIITDIHHGPPRYTKKGAEALPLLESFVKEVSSGDFDLLVDLGDRITNVDKETDWDLANEVADIFRNINVPTYHLLGNHDLHYLSVRENELLLGSKLSSHSRDVKGKHLVFWNINLSNTYADNQIPSDSDLSWLNTDLNHTELPTIIFTHVPLDNASMVGNFWFQNNVDVASLQNTGRARKIIEASGKVILCIAGHTHWNKLSNIDGIHYLTIQSLSESFTTGGMASEAWAELTIDEVLHCVVHGNDRILHEVASKKLHSHWISPRPAVVKSKKGQVAGSNDPIKGLLIDMDGVIYSGEEAIPGSPAAIRLIQERGIKIVFLTNNARRSPNGYVRKLEKLGITIEPENIITSGVAVGNFVRQLDAPPKVHIIGSAALRKLVLAAGALESDEAEYVIAGMDLGLNIGDFTVAARHLINGAKLLATNTDAIIPTQDGPEPEAGPVVAFLEAASGQQAYNFGKPQQTIFDLAIERAGVPRNSIVMIGDTLATDIAGANSAGLRSVLVESGNPIFDLETNLMPTMRAANLEQALPLILRNTEKAW